MSWVRVRDGVFGGQLSACLNPFNLLILFNDSFYDAMIVSGLCCCLIRVQ